MVANFSVELSGEQENQEDQEKDEKGNNKSAELDEVQQVQRAIVVADYTSETVAGLNVNKGDYIDVLNYNAETGWAGVATKENKAGYIPVYCVEMMTEVPSTASASPPAAIKESPFD